MYLFRTIGQTSCDVDGAAVKLPPLTFLCAVFVATHPKGIRREHACEALWPDNDRRLARHSLSQQIYRLQAALPGFFESRSAVLRANANSVRLDVQCPGMVAADLLDPISEGEYFLSQLESLPRGLEHWRDEIDQRHRRDAAQVLRVSCQTAERESCWNDLLRYSRALAIYWPTIEAYTYLVTATTALGDYSARSAAIRRGKELFGSQWSPPDVPQLPQVPHEGRFVGRVAEFDQLRRSWTSAKDGHSALILVTGEPGIGKTRLVTQLKKLVVLQSGNIIDTRCFAGGTRIAYASLVNVFQQVADIIRGPVPGWVATTLAAISEAGARSRAGSRTRSAISDPSSFAHALAYVVTLAAESAPLLMVLDDCQWADDSTIELLRYVCERCREKRLLIACCARTGEDTKRLARLMAVADEVLSVPELTSIECQAFADHVGGSLMTRDALAHAVKFSGGNPYYLLELLRTVGPSLALESQVEVPPTVRRLVQARWSQLSQVAKRVSAASAVLNSNATEELVATVSGLRTSALLAATEELIDHGFMDSSSPHLLLRHELLREAVYAEIGGKVRSLLHARAARALWRRRGPSASIAEHAKKGALPRLAWRASVRAADHAASVGASDEALHWYERAMSDAPSKKHWLRAADRLLAAAAAGVVPEHSAAPYVVSLRSEYARSGSSLGLLRCDYVEVYDSLIQDDPIAGRVARLTSISAEAERLGDPLFAFEALKEAISSALHSSDRAEVAGLLQNVLQAGNRHSELAVAALSFGAIGFVACGSGKEALACGEEAVRIAEDGKTVVSRIQAYAARGAASSAAGKLQSAQEDFETAIKLVEQHGPARGVAHLWVNYGVALMDQGRHAEAIRIFNSEIRGLGRRNYLSVANRVIAAYELGDYELALEFTKECGLLAQRMGAEWLETFSTAARGLIALAQRDITTARYSWHKIEDRLDSYLAAISDPAIVVVFAAKMYLHEGDLSRAVELLDYTIRDAESRNAVVAARLRLELAEIVVDKTPDTSYRLAKDVERFGAECGSAVLGSRAAALLEQLQIRAR